MPKDNIETIELKGERITSSSRVNEDIVSILSTNLNNQNPIIRFFDVSNRKFVGRVYSGEDLSCYNGGVRHASMLPTGNMVVGSLDLKRGGGQIRRFFGDIPKYKLGLSLMLNDVEERIEMIRFELEEEEEEDCDNKKLRIYMIGNTTLTAFKWMLE